MPTGNRDRASRFAEGLPFDSGAMQPALQTLSVSTTADTATGAATLLAARKIRQETPSAMSKQAGLEGPVRDLYTTGPQVTPASRWPTRTGPGKLGSQPRC